MRLFYIEKMITMIQHNKLRIGNSVFSSSAVQTGTNILLAIKD